MKKTAIITDSKYRMSLAVVRSLGRAGIPVHCLEDRNTPAADVLAFRSRYAGQKHFVASSRQDPEAFVNDILKVSNQGDVVIPVSLGSIFAISANLSRVRAKLKVVLPSLDSLSIADDTGSLLGVAEKVGVPIPRTFSFNDRCEAQLGVDGSRQIKALGAAGLRFPVVVKYRRGEGLQLSAEQRYSIVRDPASFPGVYGKMSANQASPLVQEYVPGAGYGMSALFDQDSQPVAVFCHRRIREYPVTGGPSCLAESVWDPKMVNYGVRLLRELKWQGVAMVEFKGDIEAGNYRLMEINPRFWGSLPLALLAGVDFPVLLYRVALGEKLPAASLSSPDYSVGVKMRFLFQDLLSMWGYLQHEANKMEFFKGFVGDLFDPEVSDGVFQWDDPKPNLAYTVRAFRQLFKGGGS